MDITNKKILVCDDSVLARKQLVDAVEEVATGATFIEGKNGAEAVELYKSEKPDLVFMDIVMPEKPNHLPKYKTVEEPYKLLTSLCLKGFQLHRLQASGLRFHSVSLK